MKRRSAKYTKSFFVFSRFTFNFDNFKIITFHIKPQNWTAPIEMLSGVKMTEHTILKFCQQDMKYQVLISHVLGGEFIFPNGSNY